MRHGAGIDPPNRFERTRSEREYDHVEGDDEYLASLDRRPVEFLDDATRSIVAENDSSDVPFRYSVNPYRGCEHGCSYCLGGDTPILMGDGTTRPLRDLRVGDVIYGTVREGWYRRYVRTRVSDHWRTVKPAYRVMLTDGTALTASADHRFLTERGWKHVAPAARGGQRPVLTVNNKLMGTGRFAVRQPDDRDYRAGYLAGMIRGDALLASYRYVRVGREWDEHHRFRLALVDDDALDRTARYLDGIGVPTRRFVFQRPTETGREIRAIRTNSRESIRRIREVVATPEPPTDAWRRGFLAGIFDAEGGYSGGILRIVNTDRELIALVTDCLRHERFRFVVEPRPPRGDLKPVTAIRLCGGLREHLRFFHTVDPAIRRKRDFEGRAVKGDAELGVVSVEPLGVSLPLYDITTGTGDFIADGVVSHNCFARPGHEYLGFNAGIDFETKIVVKRDAPALLREFLARPKWVPEPIVFSGVTDCYQPAERRFRLTRGCLEVCAEARQPVSIITKNALVVRDLDLLRDMAASNLVHVNVSLTTLDADLARAMEPRTSTPAARLRAIGSLAEAGVPVRVMTAPVIPGLNDHELPSLLAAAAEAGATQAAFTLLRLPLAVGPVFLDWLRRERPDAAGKVEGLVRAARGGRLNDPRFGERFRPHGERAERIAATFRLFARRHGLDRSLPPYDLSHFRPPLPTTGQLRLF